jgi:hypothetical protein
LRRLYRRRRPNRWSIQSRIWLRCAVAAWEALVSAVEGDLLADELLVALPPAGQVRGSLRRREHAEGVPVVVRPERSLEQRGVVGIRGPDPVLAGGLAERPAHVELARVERRVGPPAHHRVLDRLGTVGDDPLRPRAFGVDLIEEVEPGSGRLVRGEADPPGHVAMVGVVAADRHEYRAAALVAVPARVGLLRSIRP